LARVVKVELGQVMLWLVGSPWQTPQLLVTRKPLKTPLTGAPKSRVGPVERVLIR
jgi:hypothetical protein